MLSGPHCMMTRAFAFDPAPLTQFYRYGIDWQPTDWKTGRSGYVRWYINDILVMELNANATKGGTNDAGQSVGDRLIPEEPSYITVCA
jgi:hypothetical protein